MTSLFKDRLLLGGTLSGYSPLEVHPKGIGGRESLLNRIVEIDDRESAGKHIEMIHSIKNKLDKAHVIYLWRE